MFTLYGDGIHYDYPAIQEMIDSGAVVKNSKIDTVHRRERDTAIPTVYVGENAFVGNMILSNITVENHTDLPMPLFCNDGEIDRLHTEKYILTVM